MWLHRTCIIGAVLLLGLCARAAPAEDRPPNVVLIFTDDEGTLDLGSYGSEDLHTPHLDALAEYGVRFTQFYAAVPVDSPAESSASAAGAAKELDA